MSWYEVVSYIPQTRDSQQNKFLEWDVNLAFYVSWMTNNYIMGMQTHSKSIPGLWNFYSSWTRLLPSLWGTSCLLHQVSPVWFLGCLCKFPKSSASVKTEQESALNGTIQNCLLPEWPKIWTENALLALTEPDYINTGYITCNVKLKCNLSQIFITDNLRLLGATAFWQLHQNYLSLTDLPPAHHHLYLTRVRFLVLIIRARTLIVFIFYYSLCSKPHQILHKIQGDHWIRHWAFKKWPTGSAPSAVPHLYKI